MKHMRHSYHKATGWTTRPNLGKAYYQTKAGKWIPVVVYWKGVCKNGKERARVGFEGKGPSDDFWVDASRLRILDILQHNLDWCDDNDIYE